MEAQMTVVSVTPHTKPHAKRPAWIAPVAISLVLAAVLAGGTIFAITFWSRPLAFDTTGSINACMAQQAANFSPRVFEQCVSACLTCEHGTRVTCSTSCRLRGAS
jgi:hypothetical protein